MLKEMELETTENIVLEEHNQTQIIQSPNKTIQNQEQQPQEAEVVEEKEQPLYKLNNIDTEAMIKSELKQIILTKISEEINSKSLNDMTYALEEQIACIRTRTESLQSKITGLKQEVNSDKTRLAQSESILLKTGEMISLMKENIDKLAVKIQNCYITELSGKTLKQHQNLLQNSYLTKLEKAKKELKQLEKTTTEELNKLRREFEELKRIYESCEEKLEEFRKSDLSPSELQDNVERKGFLEAKMLELNNRKAVLEEELKEQKTNFSNFSERETQIKKFEALEERKQNLELELQKLYDQIANIEADLAENTEKIKQKEPEGEQLRESLKVSNEQYQTTLQKLQEEQAESSRRLEELKAQNHSSQANFEELQSKLNNLKSEYLKKIDKKESITHSFLQKIKVVHETKLNLLKKEMENKAERAKCEELKNQNETAQDLLKSILDEIERTKIDSNDKQNKLKIKREIIQNDKINYGLEIKKQKEYLLANNKFLEEKSENLKLELTELEKNVNNLKEENQTTQLLIQNKIKQFEDSSNKLKSLRNNEVNLKSVLKFSKKENVTKNVKFNDILSFKSPTSSEISISADNPPDSSFHDWLKDSGKTSSLQQIEEEY